MPEYRHNYFQMDIDEALSHTAANLNQVHQEVDAWNLDERCFTFRLHVQDYLLELTEAMQFLGACVAAHRQEHEEER